MTTFLALTFADLKKFKFYYWFAYPALVTNPPLGDHRRWSRYLEADLVDARRCACVRPCNMASTAERRQRLLLAQDSPNGDPQCGRISTYASFFEGVSRKRQVRRLCRPIMAQHRLLAGRCATSWHTPRPLRVEQAQSHLLKDGPTPSSSAFSPDRLKSVVGQVRLPVHLKIAAALPMRGLDVEGKRTSITCKATDPQAPSGVGWERNAQGKLAPKVADLGH